eukprot:1931097-Rhodomonas_salina.1
MRDYAVGCNACTWGVQAREPLERGGDGVLDPQVLPVPSGRLPGASREQGRNELTKDSTTEAA